MKLYDSVGKPSMDIDTSKEINRGGEGAIYEHPTTSNEVIKVYHTNGNLTEKVLKELMKLPDNFIKPLELFYDKQKRVKGLSMKYLDTHKLVLLAHIFNKAAASKAGFTNAIKKGIWENMILSITDAHREGIVIGDLNPYNIFVSTKAEVYFIDVDSFQTITRPHSGVMLAEIRDWLHNGITAESDSFAASIMLFQLFTHVHPYKGIHSKVKTLEERMIKRMSILSGDKDIIIPSFYEPFANKPTVEQFIEVFQNDKRFFPMLGGNMRAMTYTQTTIPVASMVQAITEGEMVIRTISIDVEDFDCTDELFYIRKDTDKFTIYSCRAKGDYTRMSEHQGQAIFLGHTNVVLLHFGRLYNATGGIEELIHNFVEPLNSFMFYQAGKAIYFDGSSDTYCLLNINEILNSTKISFTRDTIYTKSVAITSGGILQSVMGMKWILDISGNTLKTLRTNLNIQDVYMVSSGRFGVAELKTNSGMEHHLFTVEGMQVTLGPKLNGMLHFAHKGDYLYIPSSGALEVYRTLDLAKVATIACKYVNEQSILRSCNAGILCLTAGTLYLLNKV